jgi:hypothetical protein
MASGLMKLMPMVSSLQLPMVSVLPMLLASEKLLV